MVYIFMLKCEDNAGETTIYNCISKSAAITLSEKLQYKYKKISIIKNKLYSLSNLGELLWK